MKTALLILVLYVSAPAIAPAQNPSLADVARQERARQKNARSTATFTNETLGKSGAAPEAASSPGKTSETASATAEGPHDETWWRDAFKKAHDDVKRTEDRTKVLQLELNQLNMDLLRKSDLYNREGVLAPQITAKNGELRAAEKEAEQARQKVLQLEDDLRRSGGPAGWAR